MLLGILGLLLELGVTLVEGVLFGQMGEHLQVGGLGLFRRRLRLAERLR